jgi:hypothetical protein
LPLRTLSLGLISNSDPDPAAAIRYALDLAGRTRAHLSAQIGAPPRIARRAAQDEFPQAGMAIAAHHHQIRPGQDRVRG